MGQQYQLSVMADCQHTNTAVSKKYRTKERICICNVCSDEEPKRQSLRKKCSAISTLSHVKFAEILFYRFLYCEVQTFQRLSHRLHKSIKGFIHFVISKLRIISARKKCRGSEKLSANDVIS